MTTSRVSQPATFERLSDRLTDWLAPVRVLPLRLFLQTEAELTPSSVRSVFGRAVHSDTGAWNAVFRPTTSTKVKGDGTRASRAPAFVVHCHKRGSGTWELDCVLAGEAGASYGDNVLRAFQRAGRLGVGAQRLPFQIDDIAALGPEGTFSAGRRPWSLAEAVWPHGEREACDLNFTAGVRILWDGQLVEAPTLLDFVVAARHRMESYGAARGVEASALAESLNHTARETPCVWTGTSAVLSRYSATQLRRLRVPAICGTLRLPAGVSACRPLLAAARWLNIGKNTTDGLGEFTVSK